MMMLLIMPRIEDYQQIPRGLSTTGDAFQQAKGSLTASERIVADDDGITTP